MFYCVHVLCEVEFILVVRRVQVLHGIAKSEFCSFGRDCLMDLAKKHVHRSYFVKLILCVMYSHSPFGAHIKSSVLW